MTTDRVKTQVYYLDHVGWVMKSPSLEPLGIRGVLALPENDVVRVTDADGRTTLLQLVEPKLIYAPPAVDTARPVLEPLAYPVAVTVEGLSVEVPRRRKLSARAAAVSRRHLSVEAQETHDSDTAPDTLLDFVTFAVEPGELVAVIGPSGAGKSILVKALIGDQQCGGRVTYNSRVFDRETVDQLRHLLGYVPQEGILHNELRLEDALLYSARLRLPQLARLQQHQAVTDVLAGLALTAQAEQPLRLASGGEQKRASVATELLTRPAVLFLDEPTTGLDPDAEDSLLNTLCDLAHHGRHTVLMVTHSVAALESADKVLVIARGRVAFVGAPADARAFFAETGLDTPGETLDALNAETKARTYPAMYRQLRDASIDWAAKFERSPAYQTSVEEAIERNQAYVDVPATGSGWASRPSQFVTLALRSTAVIRGAKGYMKLLAWQAPTLLVSLLAFLWWDNLSGSPDQTPRALLIFLVFSAVAVGLVNSCREIVKELPVYNRERTVGLSVRAYLFAKFAVLAVLSLGQSLVLSAALLGQGGPSRGLLSSWRIGENWLLLWTGMLATVALGLLISALAKTDVRAQVMIPIILVLQLLLTGALLDVQKPVIQQLGYTTGSYWLFSGMAASNNLIGIERACVDTSRPATGSETAVPGGPAAGEGTQVCPSTWRHETAALITSLLALVALTVVYLALAGAALKNHRPAPE